MSTTKLLVYNRALTALVVKALPNLTMVSPERRVLDENWDSVTGYCLAQGAWNFAMRTIQIDATPSVEPSFGYANAFTKPSDWVSTFLISVNERLDPPLMLYSDEAGYWYADDQPLYVKYVSSDPAYGGDLSLWPALYAEYVAIRLAVTCCARIKGAADLIPSLMAMEAKARKAAAARDAMDEPPISPPRGTWVKSRVGYGTRYPWDWSR